MSNIVVNENFYDGFYNKLQNSLSRKTQHKRFRHVNHKLFFRQIILTHKSVKVSNHLFRGAVIEKRSRSLDRFLNEIALQPRVRNRPWKAMLL